MLPPASATSKVTGPLMVSARPVTVVSRVSGSITSGSSSAVMTPGVVAARRSRMKRIDSAEVPTLKISCSQGVPIERAVQKQYEFLADRVGVLDPDELAVLDDHVSAQVDLQVHERLRVRTSIRAAS